jgi:hypothetical protein
MQDDIDAAHHTGHFVPVSDIAEVEVQVLNLMLFLFQEEKFGLIVVDSDNLCRIIGQELTQQLAADGAADASDEDPFIFPIIFHIFL